MKSLAAFAAAAAAAINLGCAHHKNGAERETLAVDVALKVTEDGAGGYIFSYDGPFFDEKGNFDFSEEGAVYKTIALTFNIADAPQGLQFKADGTDAMWIVDKKDVDPATGSPRGPYQGEQFSSFRVSNEGRALSVVDKNDDGVLYRYGLRFDLGAETINDDPDGQNGGPGGHG